ncbi:MAG: hypothetical protein E6F98_01295 [Actinobacteria bacterium]|nr:MAG: hypothetical protein E6F98_01295 [Actinomycetota bacterium]
MDLSGLPDADNFLDVRVFSIGGTGTISRAVTQLLTRRGVDLTLLNRGQRDTPRDVRSIHADPSRRAGRCGRAAQ